MTARENSGEQNAVVIAVGLVAKDDDLEAVGAAASDHVFDQARPGHPIADNGEPPLRVHGGSVGPMRTAHTLKSGIRLTGSSSGLVRRFAD